MLSTTASGQPQGCSQVISEGAGRVGLLHQGQDSPTQNCKPEPLAAQILAAGAWVRGRWGCWPHFAEEQTGARSIASPDPPGPAPRGCAPGGVDEGVAAAQPQDLALAHSPAQPQPCSHSLKEPDCAGSV